VSPLAAEATAARRLPGPASLQLLTAIVAACTGEPIAIKASNTIADKNGMNGAWRL
jgi:hypothetical protein